MIGLVVGCRGLIGSTNREALIDAPGDDPFE